MRTYQTDIDSSEVIRRLEFALDPQNSEKTFCGNLNGSEFKMQSARLRTSWHVSGIWIFGHIEEAKTGSAIAVRMRWSWFFVLFMSATIGVLCWIIIRDNDLFLFALIIGVLGYTARSFKLQSKWINSDLMKLFGAEQR